MVFSLVVDKLTHARWASTGLVVAAIAALGTASPGSAYMLNLAPAAENSGTMPAMGNTAPGMGAESSSMSDFQEEASHSEEGFSMQTLRREEVRAAVNVITFIHDAMEEIDMLRMPLDLSAEGELPTSAGHGASAPAAPASAQMRPADALRTDMRMRTARISTTSSNDDSRIAQRESEKREHRLEARDANLGRQLQMDANAEGNSGVGTPPAKAGFDPEHNELGYARYYNDVISDPDANPDAKSDSGSLLVKLSLCLLAMGLLQRGLSVLLTNKTP